MCYTGFPVLYSAFVFPKVNLINASLYRYPGTGKISKNEIVTTIKIFYCQSYSIF